jgi:Fe-S cluster assembly protein SufD
MTELMEPLKKIVTNFDNTLDAPWMHVLRSRGASIFGQLHVPTTAQEEWRDTNVSLIERTSFSNPAQMEPESASVLFRKYSLGSEAAAELVFINGHYEPSLSRIDGLPPAVEVTSFGHGDIKNEATFHAHIGKHAKIEAHAFAALNTAFIRDGAFVHVGAGVICPKPIHLLFLSSGESTPTATQPRVLVVAEENSESSIVETYAGGDDAFYLTNAVTEIVQKKHARIDHNKLQQEGNAAFHIALMQVTLDESSQFVSHSTSLGSRLTRNDLQVFFGGERAEATLNGLVLAKGEQHIDNHTLLHHENAHCPSHELYKHVLDGHATAVFKGKIFVQKDAQKTDSKQTSKSLLLTNTAFMNSQPALEIYADDVKCTHGSTIGPVDENAVFYLISRGLSLTQARHLMTYAFAADITRRIKVTPVRARIEDFMTAQAGLPQDLRIADEARHDVALL